jgi:anti-sigma-K factor RskA
VTHERVYERLPDLLFDRDDPVLLAHVGSCHACQRQLFLLSRVDRLLRQRRPRASRRRRRFLGALAAVVAVAAAALAIAVAVPTGHRSAPARFALKTPDGSVVARAQLQRSDPENESLALVAEGLPTRPSDMYLLWTTGSADGDPVVIGRFMVNHSGACRARFNLPGTQQSGHFWVTPATQPTAVVAST